MNNKIKIFNFIGVSILLFMFSIIAILSTLLIFGGHCVRGIFSVSLILSLAVPAAVFSKQLSKKDIIVCIVAVVLIIAVCIIFCGAVHTYDWDGNMYHKLAVGLLKNGWNPIKESAVDFSERYFNSSIAEQQCIWVDHYGKATWMFGSVIYYATNNIECGKAYQFLGSISLFCIALSYFYSHKKKIIPSLVLAFLLAFNPVSLCQIISYYVDGFLFTLLYILIIALFQLVDKTIKDKKIPWITIFSSMLILSNVKFTGLLYGGIVCILMYAYMLIHDIYINKNKIFSNKSLIKTFGAFAILAVLCVCWIGYSTYIQNFIDHQNFTYPLTGEGKIDIITNNSPAGFENKNHFYQLFYGIFGQMENLLYDISNPLSKPKIPFSVYKSELLSPGIDTRISGFGVFFSGVLIISIIGICRYVINKNSSKNQRIIVGISTTFLLIMTVTIPAGWWARYNPFMWLIPFIYLFIFKPSSKTKNILYYALCTIIVLNTSHFAGVPMMVTYYSYKSNSNFNREKIIKTDLRQGEFVGVLFNFEDNEIEYEVVPELKESEGEIFRVPFVYNN